jgi:hypothetical protein
MQAFSRERVWGTQVSFFSVVRYLRLLMARKRASYWTSGRKPRTKIGQTESNTFLALIVRNPSSTGLGFLMEE